MTLPTILYFSSILLTCLLTGFLAWYAWRQPPTPGVRMYALMVLAESLMALVDLLSMLGSTAMQAAFWFKLRYSFSAIIPVFWLIFALEYNGRKSWLSKGLRAGLCIVPVITLIMQVTNDLHGLWIKQDVSFYQNGPFWIAETSARIPGLWFMVHSFYSFILLLAGVGVILFTAWRKGRLHRLQAALISAGALIALGTTLIPIFNLLPQLKFNPYIPGIGISALLYALAIFRFQFLKHSPAQEGIQSISRLNAQERKSLAALILVFILFSSGIAAASYLTYKNYQKQFLAGVQDQLSAIADLKVGGLENWRAERMSDGKVIFNNSSFSALVQNFLEESEDTQAEDQLQAWLDTIRISNTYDQVFLLDTLGVAWVSSPDTTEPVAAHLIEEAAAVLQTDQVTFMDLHRDSPGSPVHIAILVPVFADQDQSRPLGLVVLSIDPEAYLYPYLQRWPVPSTSAETLLVRRDGQDALYLNDLRFAQETALNLRAPLTNSTLPSAMAILGETGIVEGIDYRGVAVIADLRAVPDLPWFLVSKMDTSEVFAPLQARLWQTVIAFAMLILVTGAGLVFLWRQQRMRYFRKQMETLDALRLSEEKFRLAFETSPDSVAITRLMDGMFVSVNQGFEQISGYTRQEALGKTSAEINIWKNPEDRRKVVAALISKGEIKNYEAPFLTRSGEMYGMMSAVLIQFNGEAQNLQNITRDITERKQAEAALRESEERLRLAVSAGRMGTWDRNFVTGKLDWSVETKAMFGLAPKTEMSDEQFMNALHPEDRVPTDLAVLEALEKKTNFSVEYRALWPDGTIHWISAQGHGYYNETGQAIRMSGVVFDITERKRAEQQLAEYSTHLEEEVEARTRELKNAQEKLVRQERLAVLGQLAGSVGHELRNPLGVISNAAYYLQLAQPEAPEKVKEYLKIIDNEVRTSEKIITDLLDFSRIKSLDQMLTDISMLVEQTLERHPAPVNVSIRRHIANGLPDVFADTQQMVQVLGNLLTNAYQAMDNSGKVTISARQDGNMVAISVKDSGPGITPENMQKLFEPLFTTKLRGIGLGLAVSRRFVEANGGRLEAHSKAGKGSTFIVYLPIQKKVADE